MSARGGGGGGVMRSLWWSHTSWCPSTTHAHASNSCRLHLSYTRLGPNWIWYSTAVNSAVWMCTETTNGNGIEYNTVFALVHLCLPQYRPLRLRFRWISPRPQNIPLRPLSFPPRPERKTTEAGRRSSSGLAAQCRAPLRVAPPAPGEVAATAAEDQVSEWRRRPYTIARVDSRLLDRRHRAMPEHLDRSSRRWRRGRATGGSGRGPAHGRRLPTRPASGSGPSSHASRRWCVAQ